MSKIGKKPIEIPKDVSVDLTGQHITIKGPRGTLGRDLPPLVSVRVENGIIYVSAKEKRIQSREQWGLSRALVANMVAGVMSGFSKTLEFSGVGYKAQVKGDTLELSLGFTHPIVVKAPTGVAFQADKNTITISGSDKEMIGQIAAEIRKARPPEPYKGSGIKYQGEIIKRKAGKKAVSGA
jgi:large subunit ribosomal protein L6